MPQVQHDISGLKLARGAGLSTSAELNGLRITKRDRIGRFIPLDPRQHARVVDDAKLDGVEIAPDTRMRPLELVGDLAVLRQTDGVRRENRRANIGPADPADYKLRSVTP